MNKDTNTVLPRFFAGVFLFVVLMVPSLVWSQTSGISGRITDAKTSDPIAGANVVVVQGQTKMGTTSSADGIYEIVGLSEGIYQLTVSYIGYHTQMRDKLSLKAGETKTLNFDLDPAELLLNPVVVSASRRAENIVDAPVSITKIEGAEIQRNASASAFTSLMKNKKGVNYTQISLFNDVLNGFHLC